MTLLLSKTITFQLSFSLDPLCRIQHVLWHPRIIDHLTRDVVLLVVVEPRREPVLHEAPENVVFQVGPRLRRDLRGVAYPAVHRRVELARIVRVQEDLRVRVHFYFVLAVLDLLVQILDPGAQEAGVFHVLVLVVGLDLDFDEVVEVREKVVF